MIVVLDGAAVTVDVTFGPATVFVVQRVVVTVLRNFSMMLDCVRGAMTYLRQDTLCG